MLSRLVLELLLRRCCSFISLTSPVVLGRTWPVVQRSVWVYGESIRPMGCWWQDSRELQPKGACFGDHSIIKRWSSSKDVNMTGIQAMDYWYLLIRRTATIVSWGRWPCDKKNWLGLQPLQWWTVAGNCVEIRRLFRTNSGILEARLSSQRLCLSSWIELYLVLVLGSVCGVGVVPVAMTASMRLGG